jgi:NADH-quinone oxidoreductase subunit G
MRNAVINHTQIAVQDGTTIMEAARSIGVKIPTLCKHPDLPPSAACGICVVKVKGSAKMPHACCTPVEDGMDITTHDPEIVDVRRGVLEMILSKHPNECLTCGRNGNCELQSITADFGIRTEPFTKFVRDIPIDDSTRSVVLEPRKCILCGRCLQVCQCEQNVWALSFLERSDGTFFAPAGNILLNDSPCIHCGQCSAHCPTGAIVEYDDTKKVWDALNNENLYCVAQIAPSVRVAVGEAFGFEPGVNLAGKLYNALRRMGFKKVFDTNFGADVTIVEEATELVERINNRPDLLPLISSCCPSWVDFMEKFHSDMMPLFSTCKSPHAIVGALTKTYFAQQQNIDPSKIFMVSIMPCTSKKYEISRSRDMFASGIQDIDVSITTREFSRMIKQSGIDFPVLQDESVDQMLGEYSGAGTIFGVTGGMMEAALRTAHVYLTGKKPEQNEIRVVRGIEGVKEGSLSIGGMTINVAAAHGMKNVEVIINKIRVARQNNQKTPYQMIEVMACPGGCIGGGGQPYGITNKIRVSRINGLYRDDLDHEVRYSHDNPFVNKLYELFLGSPMGEKSHKLFHTSYKAQAQYKR